MSLSFSARESIDTTGKRRISDMPPEAFSALMFGWAMIVLPITIVISLWAIYRVILGGKLSFGEWAYKMINHK